MALARAVRERGRLTEGEDARGIATTYEYDNINRLKKVLYPDSTPGVEYFYDENGFTGFLARVIVSGVTESIFEYDQSGQLTEENVTFDAATGTFTTGYTYDLGGRLQTMTYPSGRTITYAYDDDSGVASARLASLVDGETSATLVQSVTDNAAGQLTARTLGGQIVETRAFNNRNQLTGVAAAANSTTLMSLGYGYGTNDNTGRIRTRTDAVQPEHTAYYGYDELYRLESVSGGDSTWGISWGLDRYGNRNSQTPSGLAVGRVGSPSINYSDNRHTEWTYDDAGNVTNDDVHNYTYDAESRLVQIDSNATRYAYDAAGRRVWKKANGVETFYIYGMTGLISEFNTVNTGITAAASDDRIRYRVGEQTGTPVLLADADGIVRENNRVFPFGEPWSQPVDSETSEKFTSYQRDEENGEAGLDYAMARYYASRSGRFMTPDPGHVGASVGDPQSWNAYVYVGNDPINGVDPLGLSTRRVFNSTDCTDAGGVLTAEYRALYEFGDVTTVEGNTAVTVVIREGETTGWDCDFPGEEVAAQGPGGTTGSKMSAQERKAKLDRALSFVRTALELHPECRALMNITDNGAATFLKAQVFIDSGRSGRGQFGVEWAKTLASLGAVRTAQTPITLNLEAYDFDLAKMAGIILHEIWHKNCGGIRAVHKDFEHSFRSLAGLINMGNFAHPKLRAACGVDSPPAR